MSQSELTTFNFPQQTHPRWATKRDPSQTTGTPCPVEEPGPALPATKPHGSTFPVIVFNHTSLFKTPIKNNCFSLMPFFYVHSMPFTNQNYYFKTKLPFQACWERGTNFHSICFSLFRKTLSLSRSVKQKLLYMW